MHNFSWVGTWREINQRMSLFILHIHFESTRYIGISSFNDHCIQNMLRLDHLVVTVEKNFSS